MNLYLSSYEYESFRELFKITNMSTIEIGDEQLIEVSLENLSKVNSEEYNDTNLSKYFLLERFTKNALRYLNRFPIEVYIFKSILNNNEKPNNFKELENIAWATVYDNIKDAKNHKVGK